MEITLSQAKLRHWRLDDVESLVRQANSYEVWKNLRDAFPHPYTTDDAEQWLAMANRAQPPVNFAIEVEGLAVGGIGLVPQDDIHRRSAEVGYWLGELYWGRGIATEVLRAASDYAFSQFDFCRLYAGVFEFNRASARVLEKAGYTFEGRMRQAVTKEGKTFDELIYALVRET